MEGYKWTVMAPGYFRNPDAIYFCVEPPGYEAAARNQAEVLRFMREAVWQLNYYREAGQDGMGRSNEGAD